MKKVLSKLRRTKQPEEPAGRITTDTLAEHREKVLAGGRRFKYPVQYARHKLVINAVIIGVVAILILIGAGWWFLYQGQNTSDFMYRVTRVAPVSVATIDGQAVRYSDYLMKYRGQLHYKTAIEQVDVSSEDGQRELDYIKNRAMADAVADAYAQKLAKGLDIVVTEAELEAFLLQQRQAGESEITEAKQAMVISDYYGWSIDEYRQVIKQKLLRQKVALAIDDTAKKLSEDLEKQVAGGVTDLVAIATGVNATAPNTVMYWPPTWVSKSNQDGGLAKAAAKLTNGQVSKPIKTSAGDGYYIVKLIESTDDQVNYEYIHVPLNEFKKQLAAIEKDGKLKEFISIPELPVAKR